MIILDIEQSSEAWHQARCGRITATRIKALMQGESTQGYKDLIIDIAGEIITGEKEESYSNAIMERGIELEPEARRLYESEMGVTVDEIGFIIPNDNTDFSEWIGISPDGIIDNSFGLEIKCPLRKTHLNYIKRDVLPNEYKWQVQGSLFLTRFDYWDFMSYYPNMKPFIIRVKPDLEMYKAIDDRLQITIDRIKDEIKAYNDYSYLSNEI